MYRRYIREMYRRYIRGISGVYPPLSYPFKGALWYALLLCSLVLELPHLVMPHTEGCIGAVCAGTACADAACSGSCTGDIACTIGPRDADKRERDIP